MNSITRLTAAIPKWCVRRHDRYDKRHRARRATTTNEHLLAEARLYRRYNRW